MPEPGVAQAAGRLLNRFGGFSRGRVGGSFCSGVDVGLVERKLEMFSQGPGEGQIGVCLGSPQAVVQVGDMEHQPEFPALPGKGQQQGHGVCSA